MYSFDSLQFFEVKHSYQKAARKPRVNKKMDYFFPLFRGC